MENYWEDDVEVILNTELCNNIFKDENDDKNDNIIESIKNIKLEDSTINEDNVSLVNVFASNIKKEPKVHIPDPSKGHLVKTRMCRNVELYGKCERKVCTFAHSKDELRPPPCSYGYDCRNRNCTFYHPEKPKQINNQNININIQCTKDISDNILSFLYKNYENNKNISISIRK